MVRKIMGTIFCLIVVYIASKIISNAKDFLELAKIILSVVSGAGIGNEIYKIWKAEEYE